MQEEMTMLNMMLNMQEEMMMLFIMLNLQEEMMMHLEIESTVIAAANPEGQVFSNQYVP